MATETKSKLDSGTRIIQAQSGPQQLFLESSLVDVIVYGGARGGGKSFALLLEALRNVNNPRFGAIIFRRTYPQIFQQGGLWDTSEQIYPYAGARPVKGNAIWKFPSGATVAFRHIENEADRYAWLGASIPLIGFDEVNTFSESVFFFMFSSNRSTCGVPPYIRATCNPDPDSWVAKFIEWWIDQDTGYPIPERSGVVRWFIRFEDKLIWGRSAVQLKSDYPGCVPKSFTFIAASVYDNKILLEGDPGYEANLKAMPLVDRERFLKGNWKIRVGARNILRREWFKILNERPAQLGPVCRYWDIAATELEAGKDPDWTSGTLTTLIDGQWFILDIDRFRATPKAVEDRIKQHAQTDPHGTKIRMEQEGGASGLSLVDHYARNVLPGYDFAGVPSLKNKVIRAGPLASAAEAGNVFLIKGRWNEDFLNEADNFKGGDEHNDTVDSTSSTLLELRKVSTHWKNAIPVTVGKYDPMGGMGGSSGRYKPIGF